MYEKVTFESLLERMLSRVPDTLDKREGSIIYDAIAPAAVELQILYIELDNIMNESFADTASREFLIKRAAERGLTIEPATAAILKAVSVPGSLDIPIGSRYSLNELNYIVTEKIKEGEYKVKCETKGLIGNKYFGDMIPIDYIADLESIKITELLIPGEDEESTEALRKRYFESFETIAFGGNRKDYTQKTNAIAGVGATKVTPIWQGGGTVLLTIVNSEFKKASNELLQLVQKEIDPTKDGTGSGLAPIGHIVTVRSAEELTINVTTNITFQEGYSFSGQQSAINAAVENYMAEIRKSWADESTSVVRISQIETRILNLEGVVDISGTKINGNSSNLVLDQYKIPVLGGVVNG